MPTFTGPDMSAGIKSVGKHVFADLIDKPVRFLEVGVYEGRSALWLLENILTHPLSRYSGVDNWKGDHLAAKVRAVDNLSELYWKRITITHEDSKTLLPQLSPDTFDGIHIDGCHSYGGAHEDIRNAWPLLKSGGVILCDDYLREDYGVAKAVHEFLAGLTVVKDYRITYCDYSIAWRKT